MNVEIVNLMTTDQIKQHYAGKHDMPQCHNSAAYNGVDSKRKSALEQLMDVDVSESLL